jgi:hypothetical protein
MEKPRPLTDDELKTLAQAELRQAVGYYGGKLAEQRRKAESYYYAEPVGDLSPPEIEGRSSIVVPRVRNTILSMLPPLMMKFCGGDKVVEFEATKPGDEQAASNATDYANWVFFRQNNGHAICRSWFTDALKFKNGIIKVWWDDRNEETREEYNGLTQVELAQIMDDPEVEVTEQKSYPDEDDAKQRQEAIAHLTQQMQQAQQAAQQNPQAGQAMQQMQAQLQHIEQTPPAMLYDIVCTRSKKGGKITIENVPPEEFGIARNAKSISTARFLRHSMQRTMSELRTMGYPEAVLLSLGEDENALSFNAERVERNQFDDEYASSGMQESVLDGSQRKVWVHECYMRVDCDGDGIAELRKVTLAGNEILDNVVVDVAPFVSICPIPEPHKFFGLSVADLAAPGQKAETFLLRGVFDNNNLEVNGRYFAVEGQVNLDDLLMSRPGGVVRIKSQGAVGRLDQGKGNLEGSMNMLSYMEAFNEDATGWSRTSQSFDTEALDGSETATKTRIVSNKASMRTDDVARNFADGFVELFRLILKLSTQHQKKSIAIKLSGQWQDMDPREWRNGFETTINVGLGVGDKDQQVSHLTVIQQAQAHGLQIGIATPENLWESCVELAKAMGYKNGDKFFTKPDPSKPTPNPAQAELQADMQKHQMELQAKGQMHQAEMQANAQIEQLKMQQTAQLDQVKAQMQAEVDRNRQASEAEQQTLKNQQEAQLRMMEAQHEQERHAREQANAIELEKIKAQAQIIVAKISAGAQESDMELSGEADIFGQGPSKADLILQGQQQLGEHLANAVGALHAHVQAAARPKQIVRDASGRAMGIQ